jgi:hypothetical protein
MSQLDQAIQDFVVKQNLILAQYQQGNNNLRNDIQTLVRQLLLSQKGSAVIDQGDIYTKTQFASVITDFTASALTTFTTLQVRVLELRGARSVRIMSGIGYIANTVNVGTQNGIFGFFSTVSNDTPKINDFSFLGYQGFSGDFAENDVWSQYADIPCATAKFLYMIFPAALNDQDFFSETFGGIPGILSYATYQLLS